MQRVFETTIPEALSNELDAPGIRTPDQLGTALEDALKKLKAGGWPAPFTEDLRARLLKKSRSGPGSVKHLLRCQARCAPGVTRTPGTQFRKLLLYPPELRGRRDLHDGRPSILAPWASG